MAVEVRQCFRVFANRRFSSFRIRFAVSSSFRAVSPFRPFVRACHLPLAKDCSTVVLVLSLLIANTVQMACDEGLAVGARASNRGAGVSASVSSTAVSLLSLPVLPGTWASVVLRLATVNLLKDSQ